ncbi:MAG TPA: SbmA/BacA-like family transporter [Gemmataceae bacterium]|jgi:putative ATP-binding cassette transporter
MKSKTRKELSRFRLVLKLFFLSEAGWWGVGLLALLFALVLIVKGLDIRNSYVWADLVTSATERKADLVCRLALLYAAVYAGSAIVATFLRFTEEFLGLRWRDWLTHHLTDRYFASRAYHRIKESGQLDNPDQRIAEDVKTFAASALSIFLILTNATVALIGFAGVLWSITPWLLAGAVGYAAFGTLTTILLGRRLVGLDVQQFRKEADFRYELVRLREQAGLVALLQGEAREKSRLLRQFALVLKNFRVIIGINRNLRFFTIWYGYMTQLIPVLITVPLYIRGEIEFGQVMQAQVGFNFVLDAFSLLVKEFQSLTTFAAVVERLGDFYEATEPQSSLAPSPIEIVEKKSRLAYEGLTLASADDGRLLIADLSLEIPRGQRLLVLGPDGPGRTALMRTMAGLWKTGQGRIIRPPLRSMMFLPQQPYLALGSLRDQLLYTISPGVPVAEERLLAVLQEVQLGNILERSGGLDTEQRDWTSILSLGEQQSLAFARLLLAELEVAFLDEALSALPAERVRDLYGLLSRTVATYISTSSGPDLLEYHDQLLQLHSDGTWTATETLEAAEAEWRVLPVPILSTLQVG